jgi:hypothetical protein
MEQEMMSELGPEERAQLLDWLKSCVRAMHAGFPRG